MLPSGSCEAGAGGVFRQLLTPVAGNLALSFLAASGPILVVLVLLGALRRPAWQAALAGLLVALAIAMGVWRMPAGLAGASVANGAVFALWPVMWIVVNALLVYNIAVRSGRFDALRDWIITHMPNDRRVVLIVVGFCFGALLEGVAGFGTSVAITSSLVIMVGFPALEALVFMLIFDTSPVAFGALGVPVTVLGAVTGLPAPALAAMIGRQLPFVALILPFYVIGLYGGWRSIRAIWPMLLVAGGTFAAGQFVASNYLDYTLTDVLASMLSLAATLLFLRVWRPAPDEAEALTVVAPGAGAPLAGARVPAWQGWLPWLIISATVIAWTVFKVARIGEQAVHWPGLDNAISITLYNNKPYAAVWAFQPLATGTAILLAALITAAVVRLSPRALLGCVARTWAQAWKPIVTVMLIVAVAYLMNYSGMAYTLGKGVASTGALFVLLSPFLGWFAVMLSGSDTSGNALFGNLQVVAARQLHLNPLLFAAANSSGGVMGKMISPQNIATGLAVTDLAGQEGRVFARTFIHSVVLTLVLGALIAAQQYLAPWIIPVIAGPH
ncbi:MAG TPA: L-lactate permease [Caulobacteraceae bacterium]|nr:L-lactate permease [Caulobacteraceae bacterium]